MRIQRIAGALLALAAIALLGPGLSRAAAEPQPSSEVVLPYFEVDLSGTPDVSPTSLFAICNSGDAPMDVQVTVRTNWGIPVLDLQLTLQGDEVRTVNLRDWLVTGHLPGRTLSAAELAHLQAALSGAPSPRDQLYYSTAVAPGLAVGAVTFAALGNGNRDVLWGDSFVVDPKIGFAEGETLVSVDPVTECRTDCTRHGIRFLQGGPFDSGTELMFWTKHVAVPSAAPELAAGQHVATEAKVYDEAGRLIDRLQLSLLPIQRLTVADLGLTSPFGWIDFVTDEGSFIVAHYSASDRYGAALHAWCLPEETEVPGPGIRVDKLTNGAAADLPPGPKVPVGGTVHWTYVVTNTGDTPLSQIAVTDSDGVPVVCPGDSLEPGESMTCDATGTAVACQHANTAVATGVPPAGGSVQDTDTSHYYGEERAALTLRALLNGDDANTPPGPELLKGAAIEWTYVVTNTGDHAVHGVAVEDQHGAAVACPRTALAPGESMTCNASGVAAEGQHAFMATAEGTPNCGPQASASDPTHYHSLPPPAAISIEKLTNGADADTAPGPMLLKGSDVAWTYVVTNGGGVPLTGVTVTDSRGVVVTCPQTTLAPGSAMTCTGSGTAVVGQYENVGTATGTAPGGAMVVATDPSHYLGVRPQIQFEKLVNGFDADSANGAPVLAVGSAVTWSYVTTNIGDTALSSIVVEDDRDVVVTCPKTTLQPGESMTCTGGGTAVAGLYCNLGLATGTAPVGPPVSATDPACYRGVTPQIAIEKRVNGQDADVPPGPKLVKGSSVIWTYQVTNTGDTALTAVSVTDDQGVAVTCPKTVLNPGESMACTADGKAVTGQYCNIGTARGTAGTGPVEASDPACYLGISPDIDIEKLTNGEDADTPPGPAIDVGATVLWSYVVTNTGDVPLSQIAVTDSRGVAVACPKTTLQPAESMTCTASGKAVQGQYSNVGTATGTPEGAAAVSDTDPSHYLGKVIGYEGCTPGYWKNHTSAWPPTGYSPAQTVQSVFGDSYRYPALAGSNLLQALGFAGGAGLDGAAEILLRAGVAALLSASHPGVTYPRTPGEVIANVNAALASGNRDTMLSVAAALDYDNNRGCPLN